MIEYSLYDKIMETAHKRFRTIIEEGGYERNLRSVVGCITAIYNEYEFRDLGKLTEATIGPNLQRLST
jgi:hypothetical protein